MKITALKPQEKRPERFNVFVDGAFRCGLAVEIALAAGLRAGQTITEAQLVSLERRDLLWKAREAALHLLGYRARSEVELRLRLRRKAFPEEIVDECVTGLLRAGYLDDTDFAGAFVRDRLRSRPRGERRLVQELRARGVSEGTAREAVDGALAEAGIDEIGLARDAAAGWARRALSGKAATRCESGEADDAWELRRKLYGYLARRGFSAEAIRVASDEVLEDRAD